MTGATSRFITEANKKIMVVLKIHGSSIKLGSNENQTALRIYCHDRVNKMDADIKAFVLDDAAVSTEKSVFQYQEPPGIQVSSCDLAIFMTPIMEDSSKVSYAIDIAMCQPINQADISICRENSRKVGTALLLLDPQFSSQGIQRLQIIGADNSTPIGEMCADYLIVKNPAGYGFGVPRPKWTSNVIQLDAGHRGAGSGCRADLPGDVAENTISSFNYAARHGADMVELDVMLTSDGVPVVHHDYSIKSKSNSIQIDQLTLAELGNYKKLPIHDKDCKHDRDREEFTHRDCRPFPTLEEVLKGVDKSCALNIELKRAQSLPSGKNEATHHREINDFVDRILVCINEYSNDRAILLSTLNADIAIMLRLKQTKYPVLFLTTGDCQRFKDPITKTVKNAIHFAQAFDMAGINPNAAYLDENIVRYAQVRGLLVYAWGRIDTPEAIRKLRSMGLNGVIYDKIDLIKPQD